MGPWRFLHARRWPFIALAVYMALSVTLAMVVPPSRTVGPPMVAHGSLETWVLSPSMTLETRSGVSHWSVSGPGKAFASRPLDLVDEADSLRVQACKGLAGNAATITNSGPGIAVMVASVNAGRLDFNRAYRLYAFDQLGPGECAVDSFSRWAGDGAAVLQLQFVDEPGRATLDTLNVTAQVEDEHWRMLRRGMLPVGLALICWLFASYRAYAPRVVVLGGLATVGVILFGVSISVPLKADIFALLTGGRTLGANAGAVELGKLGELLTQPFPIGGFSIFTQLHAVLFAAACFCLCLVERWAWMDLAVLALASETLQIFVPGRGPGLSDSLVDASGIGAGLVLVFLVLRSQRVRLLLQN